MWQDSAGTTAVTAVEQPVGKIDDKSGNGNHATQSTSASRPVLSARVNLLTKTEVFNNAAWTKDATTVTADATTAPDGTTTADALLETTANDQHRTYQTATIITGSIVTVSVAMKANGRNYGYLQIADGSTPAKRYSALVDLSGGSIVATRTLNTPTNTSSSITSLGSGWYRVTVAMTCAGALAYPFIAIADSSSPSYNAGDLPTYTGDVTKGIYIWGADVRYQNDGVGLPAYQSVNTSTDYATTGFPMYLSFDGTDDSLSTGSINFTGTNKLTLFAGVRKLSTAARGIVAELSAVATSAGTFFFDAPNGSPWTNYGTYLTGSGGSGTYIVTTFTTPISNVVTISFDLSGAALSDQIKPRFNGTLTQNGGSGSGSGGNFANEPLYIGRRNNASVPFNGRLYSLIVRGASTSSSQIGLAETYLNTKTRAY